MFEEGPRGIDPLGPQPRMYITRAFFPSQETGIKCNITVTLREMLRNITDLRGTGGLYESYSRVASSASHRAFTASEGSFKSPRGDTETAPTLGPSGRQERLNCWAKKRR